MFPSGMLHMACRELYASQVRRCAVADLFGAKSSASLRAVSQVAHGSHGFYSRTLCCTRCCWCAQQAQKNFVESLAAYSIVSYVLQIKDRHAHHATMPPCGLQTVTPTAMRAVLRRYSIVGRTGVLQ